MSPHDRLTSARGGGPPTGAPAPDEGDAVASAFDPASPDAAGSPLGPTPGIGTPRTSTPAQAAARGLLPPPTVFPIILAALACVLVWAGVALFTPALRHLLKYHAVALVVIAVSAELARRGRTRPAAAIFSVSIWFLTLLPPFVVGHLAIPGVVLPIIGVLAAGLLWSSTAAAVLAALASLVWAGALWARGQGLLPPPQPRTDFQFWLLLTEALFMTAVFVHVVTRALRGSLRSTEAAVRRARTLVEAAPDAIVLVDTQGRILSANRAVRKVTGLPPTALVGKSVFLPDLLAAETVTAARQAFDDLLAGRAAKPFEAPIVRPDGSRAHLEVTGHRIFQDGRPVVELVLRDITARRRADEERAAAAHRLHAAEKLEAVGQLAGGIAHDFNNLLTVVGGCADLIEEDPDATDSILELARQIQRAQAQASELTKHLLAFAERQIVEPRPISLAAEVSFRQPLFQRILGDGVVLEVGVPRVDTTVVIDPSQLEQILVNLLSNARDATQGRGHVDVEVRRQSTDRPVHGVADSAPPGTYVVLSVRDDGEGIYPEDVRRVFDPFFTTKEVGQGTGLGLSAVLGITRQLGGQVRLESARGQGTRVEVWLPLAGNRA